MAVTIIEDLFIYPIKGLAGVKVNSLNFETSGPKDDRRYMLVDQKHRFITQRSHSVLSQFTLHSTVTGWQVKSPNGECIDIIANSESENTIETSVWKTSITTREVSKQVSHWFSQQLDELVFLVEFDDLETRFKQVHGHQAPLMFADGYPLLICNSNSLIQLNEQLPFAITMNRFRPNVVLRVAAQSEYAINGLSSANGGKILFAEPCVRCNVPAIDPLTSVYQKELHAHMKELLKRDGNVVFGMNGCATNLKRISVGDEFTVF